MPSNNDVRLTDSSSSLHFLPDLSLTNPWSNASLSCFRLCLPPTLITFACILVHVDLLKHDAVDETAERATVFPKITNFILFPSSDLKSFYRCRTWSMQFISTIIDIRMQKIAFISSCYPRLDKHREENVGSIRKGIKENSYFWTFNTFLE